MSKRSSDWSRCSEGFADILLSSSEKLLTNSDVRDTKEIASKSAKTDFSHGNIFEKLAFCAAEETSQSIIWSSSEDEQPSSTRPETQKPSQDPPDTKPVTHDLPAMKPVTRKPLATRPATSAGRKRRKRSSPRGRSVRKKLHNQVAADSSEGLVIQSDSDTEAVSSVLSTSQQSSEAAIKSYDSGTEEGSSPKPEESQVTDTPESPSIADSVSSSSTVAQTGTGVKASDWVKTLQLKTPSKSENQSAVTEVEDSTKKKKKFCRGGLADRLSRLVARDKSTVRMWSHQLNKPTMSQDTKAMFLSVCGYETLYSLQAVRCTQLSWPTGATGDAGPSEERLPGGNEDAGPSDERLTGGGEKLVMFPATQAEQLSLQLGTKLKIFPPWQQLELQDGREILLCTKYCQVLSQPLDTVAMEIRAAQPLETVAMETGEATVSDDRPPKQVSGKWNCPCVQGLCRNQTLCPAYQFPCVPGWIKMPASSSSSADLSDSKDNNSNDLKDLKSETTKMKSSSHLHTVSRSAGSIPEEPVFDSLLESIERGRFLTSFKRESTLTSVDEERNSKVACFKGHVHRMTWCRDSSGNKSCRLLIEDAVGTVCEVRLMADSLVAMATDLAHLEGQSFLISGLKVSDRLVREKNSSLFSMVDQVWSGRSYRTDSQGDGLTQQDVQDLRQECPVFCYILGAAGHSGDSVKFDPSLEPGLDPREPLYTQLADLPRADIPPSRVSCVVRQVWLQSKLKNPSVVYVTDTSLFLPHSLVRIKLRPGCDLPQGIFTGSMNRKPVVLLRDLYIEKGVVLADEYTEVVSLSTTERERSTQLADLCAGVENMTVDLPGLEHKLQSGDLCTLSGCIHEVDEDSAYSWEECTKCSSESLQEQPPDSLMKCLQCGHTMVEPNTRMKMEVLVQCDRSGTRAMVDLLQPTIEKLLPREQADEDGYELTSVLRKTVGPLACVVTQTDQGTNRQHTLALAEIELL